MQVQENANKPQETAGETQQQDDSASAFVGLGVPQIHRIGKGTDNGGDAYRFS